ncbi:hypothetical protein GS571_00940 [Rhodococcus hoagii]|nr:hypothetical protein [Prescottella equi]
MHVDDEHDQPTAARTTSLTVTRMRAYSMQATCSAGSIIEPMPAGRSWCRGGPEIGVPT